MRDLAIFSGVCIMDQTTSHCEPHMDADGLRAGQGADSSAVCENCFLKKNLGKLLAGYLSTFFCLPISVNLR